MLAGAILTKHQNSIVKHGLGTKRSVCGAPGSTAMNVIGGECGRNGTERKQCDQ